MSEVLPSVAARLVIADFETEAVVFDPERSVCHYLDTFAWAVYSSCDGLTDKQTLIDSILCSPIELTPGQAIDRVDLAIAEFARADLLEPKRL